VSDRQDCGGGKLRSTGIDRLPRALGLRTVVMGTVLGGITSGLQIVRDRLGVERAEEIIRLKAERKVEEQALKVQEMANMRHSDAGVDRRL
jgi:hypothetical protein